MSLSMSAKMLEGYYLKCGVNKNYASIISELTGDEYLKLQSAARVEGAGKNSKAAGAIKAAYLVILFHSNPSNYQDIDHDVDSAINALFQIHVAAICIVACYAYAYGKDFKSMEANSTLSNANLAMDTIGSEVISEEVHTKKNYYKNMLEKEAFTMISISKSLGSKKGFLSNLLG